MKIIVNNEAEKALVKRFLEAIHEMSIIDEMEKLDGKYSVKEESDQMLWGDEYQLLSENFPDADIEVDPSVKEMRFDNSECITGTCTVCGSDTVGTIDGGSIGYWEYLSYMSEESKKTWKCESCINAGREAV